MTTKFGLKKLETSLYRTVQKNCKMCFDISNCLGVAHKCDEQTEASLAIVQFNNPR